MVRWRVKIGALSCLFLLLVYACGQTSRRSAQESTSASTASGGHPNSDNTIGASSTDDTETSTTRPDVDRSPWWESLVEACPEFETWITYCGDGVTVEPNGAGEASLCEIELDDYSTPLIYVDCEPVERIESTPDGAAGAGEVVNWVVEPNVGITLQGELCTRVQQDVERIDAVPICFVE